MTTVGVQQEASSFTSRYTYHVFLSFRGEDTRKTFTDHLYTALENAGFRTFRDDDGIERGENIKFELQKAIQESRISVVVFSKSYASSSWCLDELAMILERKRTSEHQVLPVFYHMDPSHVRKQTGSFTEAFARHEERLMAESGERRNEGMGKVEGWRAALREVADIAGMNLQNQADGHESKFIQKIVRVVGDKISRTILGNAPYLVGIFSRAHNIQCWLQDGSTDVDIATIFGMGGIGKTTIAKFLYNLNFSRFECCSYLANVREISKQQDGLLRLQRQLLSDILKGRKEKIFSVDEGIIKIKDAICCKRVLIVLDDVDKQDQLEAVLGMRDWLFAGSKIIITTRHERLLRAQEVCKVHMLAELNNDESLELFSWHAFGQKQPIDDYLEDSKRVVHHSGGLPLAIKILGSSLSGKSLNVWKSQIGKLKAIPNSEIHEKLKISYDSLQDEHDKDLFLHIACFFVGKNKDYTVTILDGCDFYTMVGIENLIDRCLLTIDARSDITMHQLLQEMGREIVRQESPKELGERSRLWNHKDSFNVLREKTGTSKIEGLTLDMQFLKEDKYVSPVIGVNRKRHFKEWLNKPVVSNVGNSLKRYRFGISSWLPVCSTPRNTNQVALEADAFASMSKLKLLQLSNVQLSGSYDKFPKGLRWLCWHGFRLQSIPNDFLSESLVVLEMPFSSLKFFSNGTKFLGFLKILNLSHSYSLVETPDFSVLPNLERLVLEDCVRLVDVHESIRHLERLVLLNLSGCNSLRKLPRSIGMLKFLETLDISGCSNLEKLPAELQNMESLTSLHADGIDINRLLSTKVSYSFIWPLQFQPRKCPEVSWASSLPRSLVSLSLVDCNLSDDAFPKDLNNLSSLRKLDLSRNPICSLPDCIRGLAGLQILYLKSCTRLHSLIGLQNLELLNVVECKLLEKVTYLSSPFHSRYVCSASDNPIEFMGSFKLEPIGDVDEEIINNLGLSNLGSLVRPIVKLVSRFPPGTRKLPLQGCHEHHIFYTYVPGRKVTAWFNLRNTGSSISFSVPSLHDDLNFRIRGLSICSLYALSNNATSTNYRCGYWDGVHTIIYNMTKSLTWSHSPYIFGEPEANDVDMMMLSYWKFKNQLEAGDRIYISVVTRENFKVKEVGVHLVLYEEEKGAQSSSSNTKEEEEEEEEEEGEAQQQIYPYGNVVPGNASSHPGSIEVYHLGCHLVGCDTCPDGDLIYNSWGELLNGKC